jgi:glutamate-ammonia-ligase adenylyltransferase
VLAGTVPVRQAGHAFADLADLLVDRLLAAASQEFAATHGHVRGGRIAVVAMGKLGGREMTAASDLDLIVLYDYDRRATVSDGARPLPPAQYFLRLTQRLLAALAAPTAEGTLYQVDFRLRPSGNAGPLASHIDGFLKYQRDEAWTWEHLALTRARPVAGDATLVARIARAIPAIVTRRRDAAKLAADVLEMRSMIEAAKGGEGAWDLKVTAGGQIDIEFIAQYLQLRDGRTVRSLISTDTGTVLDAAAKSGLLPAGEAEILGPALRLYQALTQLLRLTVDGPFRPEEAPRGLLDRLAAAAGVPDFGRLEALVRDSEAAVRGAFGRIVGTVPERTDAGRGRRKR